MKIEIPDQLPDGLPEWAKQLAAAFKSGGVIPRERLNEKEAVITTLQPKADLADTLARDLATARSELALSDAGIASKDVRDLVRWRHGQLPEANRPELGEWARTAAKDDPLLKPHLTTAAPPPAAPPAAPPPGTPPAAPPPGAPPAPPAPPLAIDNGVVPNPEPGLGTDLKRIQDMPADQLKKELTPWLRSQGMAG